MRYRMMLPLAAVGLCCLCLLAGCLWRSKEPAGQLTVVQGYVVNIRTGQPLPGVLVELVSENRAPRYYEQQEDTVRTDRQGKFTLGFTNQEGLFYRVSCEGNSAYYFNYRLDFADSTYTHPVYNNITTSNLRDREVELGKTNFVKFRASPRRVFRVRVTTRTTAYSQLSFPGSQRSYPADNQRLTVLLYQDFLGFASTRQQFEQLTSAPPGIFFGRQRANGTRQDTLVRAVPTTSTAADTVEATLSFGR